MSQRRRLFRDIDQDKSGELNISEVSSALQQLWPQIDQTEITRAFKVADEDGSGVLCEREFKTMIGFVVYFNKNRHTIEELVKQAHSGASSGRGGGAMDLNAFYMNTNMDKTTSIQKLVYTRK